MEHHRKRRLLSRPNPPSEWIVEDVPELRIVDDALWEKVSDRLADIAASPTAQAIKANRFWEKKRAKHVLTGLAVCGCCGHPHPHCVSHCTQRMAVCEAGMPAVKTWP